MPRGKKKIEETSDNSASKKQKTADDSTTTTTATTSSVTSSSSSSSTIVADWTKTKELLDILGIPQAPLKSVEDYRSRLDKIASTLLNRVEMIIAGTSHRLVEIEVRTNALKTSVRAHLDFSLLLTLPHQLLLPENPVLLE
jgi:hypothetical protein